jgi:hypothetical protein
MLHTITASFLGASKLASVMSIVIYVILVLITLNICFSLFYKISKAIIAAVQETLAHQESNIQVQQATAFKTMVTPNLTATHSGGVTAPNTRTSTIVGSGSSSSGLTQDPSGISVNTVPNLINSPNTSNSSGSPPLVPPV